MSRLLPADSVSRRALLAGAAGAAIAAATPSVASATTSEPAPVLYVSHGAPIFVVNDSARIAELRAWGTRLATPGGIVVMTPHFASRQMQLGATGPGFAMFNVPDAWRSRIPRDLQYATPPSEVLAKRVEALLGGPSHVKRADRRGFDHTTWMPLLCLLPAARAPVVELTYPYLQDAELFALGRQLARLRDEGVMFLASGGMTHNLAAIDAEATGAAIPPWSREFDVWAAEAIAAKNADELVDWRHRAPGERIAHPDDGGHYRVLLVALGVAFGAASAVQRISFPVTGFESTLSKRCVELA
jgi:4,5-DOPA dioxygenase extradiol